MQFEIHTEFCTASDKCARPGNEATSVLLSQIMVVASCNFRNSCTSKTKAQSGSLSYPQTLRMACEREEVLLTAVGSHVRRWFPWLSRPITSRVEVVSTSRRPATTIAPLLSSLRSRIPLDGFRRSRIISLYIWVWWECNLLKYFVLDSTSEY